MKKGFTVLVVIVATFSAALAQEVTAPSQTSPSDYPIFSIGLSSGWDINANAYKATPTRAGGKYFGVNPRYDIGADLGVQLSKRIRPRIEIKYVNVKYGIDWSGFSTISQTIGNIDYFDFNFHFDYLLLPLKRFEFFISPAIKFEVESGHSILNNYNFNEELLHNPGNILGGAVSGIFKYNITDHFGVTFTPEFTYFVKSFTTGNTKPYQRTSYNLGFEIKF